MSCTTLTIECFKAAYTANVGYDSLFCGLKVTCDSNVKYIRAPYVADFNGNTLMLHGWDKSETVIDDVTITGLSVAQVKDLVATCCCGDDQHLIVNNTPVGYIPTVTGNTSNLNEVIIDTAGRTWIIDINGDARLFSNGTVTSFSAGNLSPLFTTNVTTPTTTPALSFNLSNCNQYQVFGRVVAGTGAPSYVTLNPIAFNGLAIPNREVAFGNGTGITSTSNFQFTTGNSLKIGTGTVTGSYGINMGAGSNESSYVLNIGGGIVNNRGNVSLIICESGSEISGSSNANLAVLIGGNNNKIIAGTDAYGNVIIGATNTVTSTTTTTTYNRILGNNNTITDAYYNNILGISNNISSSGAYSAYYNDIIGYSNSISGTTSNAYHNKIIGVNNTISNGGYNNTIGRYCNNGGYSGVLLLGDGDSSTLTATASNQFNSRFSGGYRFMQNGSTQWMAIAPTTGYVTINNIPTAASATDILVSNGGVVSTRTVASLGIPVITPSALTKTDDTNVTISLGGTPATALLQGVSLTMGWTGVLAISRGGTGLGTLGTANQLLRVNSSATALEYFTPDWTSNTGTVTNYSAGNLSPLFTTNVATPTTTPALSFNLSNCDQYQVFGRVVAGTGAPSYVTLNPIAFNGLAIPNQQIVFGTGTGISSSVGLKYNGTYLEVNNSTSQGVTQINSSNIIVGSNHSAGTYNSYLRLNATQSSYRATGISVYNFSSQDHWWFGTAYSSGNFYLRVGYLNDGDIWDACRDDGSATTNSVFFIPRTTTEFHVSNTLTVHNIPTAASATDILVSNGGVVSTRTVASLGIPVITPAALTKTDDTNVTISLGGTPATSLLQGVSLTLGWTGILAIGRGGTGLGTLGTVNQLLRVNSGGTALEYFSPTWTSNTGTVTSVAASVGGTALGVSGTPITSSGTLAFAWAGTSGQYVDGQGNLQNFPAIPAGTVTSVNASISGALSVSGGPITTSGTLAFSWTGTSGQYVRGDGSLATFPSIPAGTVTSVALALPSNTFDISGSPVTSLGTLTGAFKSQIKKTVLAAPWGADGTPIWRQLQTSDLQQNGATTGQVITWNGTEWAAANPTGGVTSVAAGNGMNFTTITATGSVVLGTPSSITLSSTNSVTSTSHTHAFVPGGTSSQYIRGDGVLQAFPTIPSNAVWKIQGGSTDATTNTDDIYHNAKVRIGNSTASSFQLSVVGQAYISSGAIINNSVYYSAYASDAVATELLGITSSNLIKVGAPKSGSKSFDIYLPNYTSSRAADTMSAGDSFLFAASSGVMYKQGGQWVRNYGASVFTTADESHIADSTPRRVTFDSYVCNNDYGYFSYSFSSGDYKVAGATGQMFMVICTLEYTTSGTPTVTAQLRVGGATKETNISTSADGRKVMTIHTVTAGGGSGNFEVYLSVSGSAITLKKCRLSVMPLGAECP